MLSKRNLVTRREILKVAGTTAFAASASSLLAACAPAAEKKEVDTPLGEAPAQEAVELRLTFWGDLADMPTWNAGIDKWHQANPKTKIKWENSPWSEYWTKLQTEMAGGTSPDVVGMVSMYSQQYIRQGSLYALDDLIAKTPDIAMDDFWPAIMKAYSWKGKTYALPYDLSTMCMMYNKTMFDEAGLAYPTEWTWDEFLTAMKKLTKDTNGDGTPEQFGYVMPNFDWTLDVPLGMNNARFISEDGTKCMLDTPEAIETLQWLSDLRNMHHVAPTPGEAGDIPLFESGLAAVTWGNPETVQELTSRIGPPRKNDKFLWDVCYFPKKTQLANAMQGGSFSIGHTTKYVDRAWEFIKFYTSGPQLDEMVGKPSRGIPGRKSVAKSLINDANPVNQVFFLNAVDQPSYSVFIPAYAESISILQKYTDQVFLGQMTAAEACPKIVAELNPVLLRTASGA